jgi:hypothetical protein
MKTKALLILGTLFLGGMKLNAQDLAPGINYAYNPPGADGVIHSIEVDVVNNDGTGAGSFDVAMYLYDMSTSNYWVIGSTTINSLSGNSVITISNWDIDINNTPNIPAGSYRLGVWVDRNDDVSETDENNNTGLLAGTINYTPSSASGISTPTFNAAAVKCTPNPSDENASLVFTLTESALVSVELYDMTGRKVNTVASEEPMTAGQHTVKIETQMLPAGIYFWTLRSGELSVTRKMVVSH